MKGKEIFGERWGGDEKSAVEKDGLDPGEEDNKSERDRDTEKEIAKIKAEVPVKKLVESPNFSRQPLSLKKSLLAVGSSGIIEEYKRQSPSKGIINDKATNAEVTNGY